MFYWSRWNMCFIILYRRKDAGKAACWNVTWPLNIPTFNYDTGISRMNNNDFVFYLWVYYALEVWTNMKIVISFWAGSSIDLHAEESRKIVLVRKQKYFTLWKFFLSADKWIISLGLSDVFTYQVGQVGHDIPISMVVLWETEYLYWWKSIVDA